MMPGAQLHQPTTKLTAVHATLQVYDKLNSKLPVHVPAPRRKKMLAMCAKYDGNGDGKLDVSHAIMLRVPCGRAEGLAMCSSARHLRALLRPTTAAVRRI
jgi:hypothetical protein